MNSPRLLLILGIVPVLSGIALPFLMAIKILESTFFLNFLSRGASVTGWRLGRLALSYFQRAEKNKMLPEQAALHTNVIPEQSMIPYANIFDILLLSVSV